jgi:hypothetical protein
MSKTGSLRPNREAQGCRGGSQPVIEAHEWPPLRTLAAPDQGRRQLRRIGRANTVCVWKILGQRSDLLGWKYLVPSGTKLPKQPDRGSAFHGGELALPNKSGERAARFEWRAPPNDHPLRFTTQPPALCSRRLRATERNDCARVPEHVSLRRDLREEPRQPPGASAMTAVLSRTKPG